MISSRKLLPRLRWVGEGWTSSNLLLVLVLLHQFNNNQDQEWTLFLISYEPLAPIHHQHPRCFPGSAHLFLTDPSLVTLRDSNPSFFRKAFKRFQTTQSALHNWDPQMGLKQCHSSVPRVGVLDQGESCWRYSMRWRWARRGRCRSMRVVGWRRE